MTATIDHRPPESGDLPGPGFTGPEDAATIFLAEDWTPAEVLEDASLADEVRSVLADAMELLTAEGYTPACCRDLVSLGAVPVASAPPAPAPQRITDYWTAGLKFYATGRTAEALRVMAANPEMVHGLAVLSVITDDEEREQMLGIASAIDALKAKGLTPEQAYFLAGLDRVLGVPFAQFTPALLSPEPASPAADAGHCLRCGAAIPAGTFYCDPCAAAIG